MSTSPSRSGSALIDKDTLAGLIDYAVTYMPMSQLGAETQATILKAARRALNAPSTAPQASPSVAATDSESGSAVAPAVAVPAVVSEIEKRVPQGCVAVPLETLEQWNKDLAPFWFGSRGDGDEYNNEEIIAMSKGIQEMLRAARR